MNVQWRDLICSSQGFSFSSSAPWIGSPWLPQLVLRTHRTEEWLLLMHPDPGRGRAEGPSKQGSRAWPECCRLWSFAAVRESTVRARGCACVCVCVCACLGWGVGLHGAVSPTGIQTLSKPSPARLPEGLRLIFYVQTCPRFSEFRLPLPSACPDSCVNS